MDDDAGLPALFSAVFLLARGPFSSPDRETQTHPMLWGKGVTVESENKEDTSLLSHFKKYHPGVRPKT